MTQTSTTTGRRYIYAIVRVADADSIQAAGLQGLFDEAVRVDRLDQLAVVSSAIDVESIRPRRQLLSAHQNVVAEISKHWDLLPVSFGLIAANEAELISIISSNTDELQQALDRVSGKVEMNLVLSWAVDNVFQYLVGKHPEMQAARDRIASGEASRDEMIELGRQFDLLLKSERSSHAEALTTALAHQCDAIEQQDPKSETEVVRLQCLIPRDGESRFTSALHEAAAKFDDDYAFAFNGPWPPYSFVNLKLSVG